MTARAWTAVAGAAVAACVAILLADYAVAARRAPGDDQLIKSLQLRVKADAALSPSLAAEQKRMTSARRARKSRDNAVAWLLIAAASAFLTFARQTVPLRAPAAPAPPAVRHGPTTGRSARLSAAPALDLAFVDELVSSYGPGKENAIALLQAIQSHYRYLPDEAMRRLCERTEITPAQLAGTSSFYGQFRGTPVGKHLVRVCHGTACHVAGARQISDELRRYLAIPENADTDTARMFTLGEVACLGCCSLAPVLMVDGHTEGRLTPSGASAALAQLEETEPA